jgi:PAS domain S-box-containing protein
MARDRLRALQAENEELRLRLEEAEGALEAIRQGHVESLVVEGPEGLRIFSLEGASHSYRVLIEAMSEGAATLSDDVAILYCNARFAEMLGAPLERVMGSSLLEWIPAWLRSRIGGLLQEAHEGESRGELSLRRQDGQELPVAVSLKSFHDNGRHLRCLVATDLSEQKHNEQVLAEGRLARSVLEQAADAIVVCDEKGRITRASRAAEQLAGCSPLRAHFDAAYPVVLSSPLLAGGLASTALRGVVTRTEPATLTRVDGTNASLLVSATPLEGADRQIIGCVVTMVDVTEHRRAEEELRATEERVRTLGDNLPEGAVYRYAQDARGWPHFVYISAGIERLTGVPPAEILRDASAWLDTIEPEDRARLVSAETRSRVTLTPLEIEVRQIHRRTGEERWALLRSVPRRLADGSTVWDGFQLDLTARKRAEDALREADRNKSHFLAVLSHELRNPLMPIRSSLQVLDRAAPGGEQARRAQAVMDRQVAQLTRLVDDLLDVTRITHGKIRIQREHLDLGEVVRRTVEDGRAIAERAGLSVELALADGELPMMADRARLAQVVGNLLSNAVKFTPRGGHVWVALERDADGRAAILRVRDDGAGIEAPMLTRLFQPFSQADHTRDRSRGGLGLGLSLVKSIVELHGGRVSASSGGAGKGAEFIVHVPLERAEAAAREVPSFQTEARPRSRRVLIIEDSSDSAESLRELLEMKDHVVEAALTGAEGLAKARQFRPDIVLCDIGLPGMNGYEVARALRADSDLRSAFLVALSGYAAPEDLARSKEAGFDDHVAKPPSFEALARILAGEPSERPGPRTSGLNLPTPSREMLH